jgi:alcohol dehydrogenase (cytochrome c)
MKRTVFVIAVIVVALVNISPAQEASKIKRPFVPVTDEMLMKPSPSDWLMWRRTQDSSGFSPLTQINRSNVAQIKMMWTRPMAAAAGTNEGTPIVYNGVMYMRSPGDAFEALDAKTGDVLWQFKRQMGEGARSKTSRAMAIWGTTIIDASSENTVFAIDARTGEKVWETAVLDAKKRAPSSGGPLIANGKVITGRQCQPDAGSDSCVIVAVDAKTGKEVWRTRTIPRPGEPGDETWGNVPPEQRWHVGTWMVPSYDPALNLIFIGTSVTIPAPKFILGGNDKQHLYHNSTLALDADTGRIVWYYQHLIDNWDLDHPFERLLVDTAVAPDPKEVPWINPKVKPGEMRRVITGIPGKTGVVYTLDRRTGEFLWARPTVYQNVIKSIDGATGKVTDNPDALFTAINQQKLICPGTNGGKNWPAGAYNPQTNVMFYPLQNMCMEATTTTDQRDPSKVYGFSSKYVMAPGTDKVGAVWAVSAETGRTVWKMEQRAGVLSLVATAGGLIFVGDVAGHFKALDDRSGKVLWETNLGAPTSGYPITFAVNGKQYVAVSTGPSLVANAAARMTPELHPGSANQMFVFALP